VVARLLCRLFGHRWGPWEQLHGSIEHRECRRCKNYEIRRGDGYRYVYTPFERIDGSDDRPADSPLSGEILVPANLILGESMTRDESHEQPAAPERGGADPLKCVLDRLFPHTETMIAHRDTGEIWPLAHGIGHVWEIIVALPPSMFPHVPTLGQMGHVFHEAYIPDEPDARGTVDLALTRVLEQIALMACDEVRRSALAQPAAPEAGSAGAMREACAIETDRILASWGYADDPDSVRAQVGARIRALPLPAPEAVESAETEAGSTGGHESGPRRREALALSEEATGCASAQEPEGERTSLAVPSVSALPAPEATGAGENPWCYVVVDADMRGWDGEYYKVKGAADGEAMVANKQVEVPGQWRVVPLYAHPTPPRAEGVEAFVVFHRSCGDEPGPASCPFEVEFRDEDGDQDAEISAVAFLSREDAESARNAFWPDGEVRAMRLLAAERGGAK